MRRKSSASLTRVLEWCHPTWQVWGTPPSGAPRPPRRGSVRQGWPISAGLQKPRPNPHHQQGTSDEATTTKPGIRLLTMELQIRSYLPSAIALSPSPLALCPRADPTMKEQLQAITLSSSRFVPTQQDCWEGKVPGSLPIAAGIILQIRGKCFGRG